ncbi:hypothetical protein BH10PSE19_BH10PSE19_06260 [soil metagenome]
MYRMKNSNDLLAFLKTVIIDGPNISSNADHFKTDNAKRYILQHPDYANDTGILYLLALKHKKPLVVDAIVDANPKVLSAIIPSKVLEAFPNGLNPGRDLPAQYDTLMSQCLYKIFMRNKNKLGCAEMADNATTLAFDYGGDWHWNFIFYIGIHDPLTISPVIILRKLLVTHPVFIEIIKEYAGKHAECKPCKCTERIPVPKHGGKFQLVMLSRIYELFKKSNLTVEEILANDPALSITTPSSTIPLMGTHAVGETKAQFAHSSMSPSAALAPPPSLLITSTTHSVPSSSAASLLTPSSSSLDSKAISEKKQEGLEKTFSEDKMDELTRQKTADFARSLENFYKAAAEISAPTPLTSTTASIANTETKAISAGSTVPAPLESVPPLVSVDAKESGKKTARQLKKTRQKKKAKSNLKNAASPREDDEIAASHTGTAIVEITQEKSPISEKKYKDAVGESSAPDEDKNINSKVLSSSSSSSSTSSTSSFSSTPSRDDHTTTLKSALPAEGSSEKKKSAKEQIETEASEDDDDEEKKDANKENFLKEFATFNPSHTVLTGSHNIVKDGCTYNTTGVAFQMSSASPSLAPLLDVFTAAPPPIQLETIKISNGRSVEVETMELQESAMVTPVATHHDRKFSADEVKEDKQLDSILSSMSLDDKTLAELRRQRKPLPIPIISTNRVGMDLRSRAPQSSLSLLPSTASSFSVPSTLPHSPSTALVSSASSFSSSTTEIEPDPYGLLWRLDKIPGIDKIYRNEVRNAQANLYLIENPLDDKQFDENDSYTLSKQLLIAKKNLLSLKIHLNELQGYSEGGLQTVFQDCLQQLKLILAEVIFQYAKSCQAKNPQNALSRRDACINFLEASKLKPTNLDYLLDYILCEKQRFESFGSDERNKILKSDSAIKIFNALRGLVQDLYSCKSDLKSYIHKKYKAADNIKLLVYEYKRRGDSIYSEDSLKKNTFQTSYKTYEQEAKILEALINKLESLESPELESPKIPVASLERPKKLKSKKLHSHKSTVIDHEASPPLPAARGSSPNPRLKEAKTVTRVKTITPNPSVKERKEEAPPIPPSLPPERSMDVALTTACTTDTSATTATIIIPSPVTLLASTSVSPAVSTALTTFRSASGDEKRAPLGDRPSSSSFGEFSSETAAAAAPTLTSPDVPLQTSPLLPHVFSDVDKSGTSEQTEEEKGHQVAEDSYTGSEDGEGFNRDGYRPTYDEHGYDEFGLDFYGFDFDGYNQYGYNQHGYNQHGYNQYGYNQHGYNQHGSYQYQYDPYTRYHAQYSHHQSIPTAFSNLGGLSTGESKEAKLPPPPARATPQTREASLQTIPATTRRWKGRDRKPAAIVRPSSASGAAPMSTYTARPLQPSHRSPEQSSSSSRSANNRFHKPQGSSHLRRNYHPKHTQPSRIPPTACRQGNSFSLHPSARPGVATARKRHTAPVLPLAPPAPIGTDTRGARLPAAYPQPSRFDERLTDQKYTGQYVPVERRPLPHPLGSSSFSESKFRPRNFRTTAPAHGTFFNSRTATAGLPSVPTLGLMPTSSAPAFGLPSPNLHLLGHKFFVVQPSLMVFGIASSGNGQDAKRVGGIEPVAASSSSSVPTPLTIELIT